MLNLDVLNRTIAAIKATDDKHFNMASYFFRLDTRTEEHRVGNDDELPHCKTAGCIAGWVVMATPIEERIHYYGRTAFLAGQELLGINDDVASELFTPSGCCDYNRITREHAIKVLEHLRDHKVLDWEVAGLKPSDRDLNYPSYRIKVA